MNSKSLKNKLQPVKGHFVIESYDKDNNLIQKYEDHNTIMTRVPFNFLSMTYGGGRRGIATPDGLEAEWPDDITLDDFVIHAFAIGTDGTENDLPKEVTTDRDMMWSEEKLWEAWRNNSITQGTQDMDKYIYQIHFSPSHFTGPQLVYANKENEGPSFPWDLGTNKPIFYDMPGNDPSNGTQDENTSMMIKSSNDNLRIDYEVVLGQYAGNGIWELAPRYNEAALYMKYIPKHLNDGIPESDPRWVPNKPIGALFSMKSFPDVPKTEACWFKIHWTIIFGDGDVEVNVITDEVYVGNFRAVLTPYECSDGGNGGTGGNNSTLVETTLGQCEL